MVPVIFQHRLADLCPHVGERWDGLDSELPVVPRGVRHGVPMPRVNPDDLPARVLKGPRASGGIATDRIKWHQSASDEHQVGHGTR